MQTMGGWCSFYECLRAAGFQGFAVCCIQMEVQACVYADRYVSTWGAVVAGLDCGRLMSCGLTEAESHWC